MKQTRLWLTTIAALLCSLTASAHDFSVDGIYYDITSSTDLTVEVTYRGSYSNSYSNEYSGAVTIPSTATYNSKTYSVTSIGSAAFSGCSSLTSITLPEGVTSIGVSAFKGCSSLTAITIPKGVTSIGDYAFDGCTSLKEVIFEDGSEALTLGYNYYSYSHRGEGLFYDCPLENVYLGRNLSYNEGYEYGSSPFYNQDKLTSVIIGDCVTSIGDEAFEDCSRFTAVYISSIEAWCKITFENSTSNPLYYAHNLYLNGELVTNLVIPEGVTSIGAWAFSGCSSLTSITISEGSQLTSIGNYAFAYCSSLTAITLLEGVTSIGAYAFSGCTSLTAITLPEGVTSIGNDAFYNCYNLSSITLPEGVTSIGAWAFSGCSSLKSITIPEGVTSIGDGAFYDCSSLTAVHISSIEAWCKITFEDFASNPFNYAHNLYLNGELVTNLVIPEGVTSIGDYAFYRCTSLTTITIPEGVTSIGDEAFAYCRSLTAITLPEGVTSIGDEAFEGCSSLTAVYISSIGAWCKIAFGSSYSNPLSYAHNLYLNGELVTNLVIPEGVTSIGDYAFYGCRSLTVINIPESVTSIGNSAFNGCSNLTAITIPEGVTRIGACAFSGCSSLTSITIPEGVTSVGNQAFDGCTSLKDVIFEDGSKKLTLGYNFYYSSSRGEGLFYDCPLENVYLGRNLSYNEGYEYGYSPFYNQDKLTSVIIGDRVTSIGNDAFYNCSSLTSINIPEGVTSIGSDAFSGCSGLKSLFVGTNVDTYGENVFEGCTAVEELAVMGSVMPTVPSDKFTTIWMFSPGPLDAEDFDAKVYRTATLYVPEGSLARYQMADVWKKFWYIEEFDPNEEIEVTLDRTTVTMTEGDVITLVATIEPQYIKTVAWTSSNTSVATVNEHGMVTAVAAGTATITAKAGDKEATCVVNVLETRYVITYLVDGEVSATDTLTCGEAITLLEPTKEGYTFSGWSYVPETYPDMTSPVKIDIAGNADAMLYTNAPCTNTSYGDQFVGWHVLFDGDANTFFHSEYSEIESADGLDHYLRVDLGEGNELSFFSFTYTTRGNNTTCNPTEIIVEGANEEDGTYTTIAVLDNLPLGRGESYFSDELGNGIAYRYIRFRVTETNYNYKVYGHPYFYFAEFGMTRYAIKVHDDVMETLVMPDRDVTFVGDFSINKYLVTFKIGEEVIAADSLEYGAAIVVPEAPEKDDHTFNGWGEVAETVPAHDVTYEGSYTGNSYLLTYIVDGDTVQADSVAYGTAIILLDEPVKEGYTFSGWSEAPDTMPAEDVTISGMFTVNIYKVYYYVGEELIHTAEVPYGEAIPEYIYEPTKEDEIFEGWVGETYATMPAHDVTYVANITNDVLQLIIDNSQLTIYDLGGRKIEVDDLRELEKGVYIVNGRKVVVND